MPRRVFIFLKKTGNSVSYLPHRQLRKIEAMGFGSLNSYLPHRQLRKCHVANAGFGAALPAAQAA